MGGRISTKALVSAVALAACVVSGCARQECRNLEARVCRDLGSDCADFRASGRFADMTPDPAKLGRVRRLKQFVSDLISPPREQLCETLGTSPNYERAFVPMARYHARFHRDPRTAGDPPRIGFIPPPEGASNYLYAVAPLFMLGAFGYSYYMRRKLGV